MNVFNHIPTFRNMPHHPIKFIFEALYGARRWFFAGIVLAFVLQVTKVYVPVYFSKMIDYFASITPQDVSKTKVFYLLGAVLIAYVAQIFCRMIRELIEENLVRNFADAKIKLFAVDYLTKHSQNYFKSQKTGELAQKITNCAQKTKEFLQSFSRFYSNVFALAVNFFFIGRVNAWFLLIILIFTVFSVLSAWRASFQVRFLNEIFANRFDEFNGTLADSISNALNVKAVGAEDYEIKYVKQSYNRLKISRFTLLEKMQDVLRVQNFVLCLFQISIFFALIYLWYHKKISIGNITLVLMLISTVVGCFERILADICDLNSLMGALQAEMMPLTVKHEIINTPHAKKLKIKDGVIEFKNVQFGYENRTVFKNLSLKIKKHEKVGIIGLSGSGKTTLINLLARAYDIDGGQILIDGQNIKDVTLNSLHDAISLISQDVSLFHRTIAQNIAYGKPNASKTQIEKAAKSAYADDFIKALAQGYQTKVGERGVKLSGGEKQRIAIARAILKNSPILIFDEATSALDSQAEKYIQKALKNLMLGKTVIVIAHRLSTLKEMDRFIVLDNGQIKEQGTKDELLSQNGIFKKFWDMQSKVS